MKKLSILLLLCGMQMIFVNPVYSQNSKITLNVKDKPLEYVFREIEQKTAYIFFYNDKAVNLSEKVTIAVEGKSIEEVLAILLKGSNAKYEIVDRQVILYSNEKEKKELQERQHAPKTITGIVYDENGEGIPGATVGVKGTSRGVMADMDGSFSLDALPTDVLEVYYLGYQSYTISVGDQKRIVVLLKPKTNELDEVTIVAFGKQKKESVISSISTINTKDLRVPSSNLTTAFAGRIAGMISYQTSGEPGRDNAEFFIRGVTSFGAGKVDPLILIDNVEVSSTDLSKFHPDDIASFSILKDATATALYGARGANGVILVTTKEGSEGKVKVSLRLENSFSQPTQNIKMADPITYMQMANEAVATRNPFVQPPYSKSRIEDTKDPNRNQYVFPAVDWMDMLTKSVAMNQRANLNISGGGAVARYYIAGSFSQDNGILNVDKRSSFNNNIDYKQYLIRSNINLNLTKTTEAIVRVHGTFDGYTGPVTGGNDMYKRIMNVSPVRFPAYYRGVNDEVYANANHILFGGSTEGFINPYAEMLKGYREENRSTMMAQMELKQDFSQWVQGLTARILGNTTRFSGFDLTRSYSPFYYQVQEYDRINDQYTLRELNPSNGGGQFLVYSPGYKTQNSSIYAEASIAYNRTFKEKHATSGMLVGIIRDAITANATTLIGSLPQRNLGLSGRFTYGYDSRYFTEFNFGYNGSEKFDKNHRWGFFPSFGLGWAVNNEAFWTDEMKAIVSKLKIRGTYGLVGNDDIGTTRFFYLSDVTIGNGVGYQTGYDFNGTNRAGVLINNYPNPLIGWETSYKTNIGLELGLFDGKIEMQADLFQEKRTNIIQYRQDVPTEMGLWRTPQANLGIANGKGIDVSMDYNHIVNKDIWLVGRANFTYARSTFNYYEEPNYDFAGTPWRSKIGYPISQQWGYVAERLFIDEEDVRNSPRQDFGPYGAGDIKYKDINGDRIINETDQVPIGRPTTPEINYGFGLSFGYKKLDVSLFFSGSARSSFWINAESMTPFVLKTANRDNGDITADLSKGDILMETGLAKFIADDYWSESSQNPNAKWPRLSNTLLANNTQRSTMFMKDGSFLRLKSIEIGYSLPEQWVEKWKLTSCRFYLSGTNLLLFSKFKLWDVELGGNGLNYPLQRVVNLGVNLSF
jgi:TonB-linked SusC/RagA family outer membrane protein